MVKEYYVTASTSLQTPQPANIFHCARKFYMLAYKSTDFIKQYIIKYTRIRCTSNHFSLHTYMYTYISCTQINVCICFQQTYTISFKRLKNLVFHGQISRLVYIYIYICNSVHICSSVLPYLKLLGLDVFWNSDFSFLILKRYYALRTVYYYSIPHYVLGGTHNQTHSCFCRALNA